MIRIIQKLQLFLPERYRYEDSEDVGKHKIMSQIARNKTSWLSYICERCITIHWSDVLLLSQTGDQYLCSLSVYIPYKLFDSLCIQGKCDHYQTFLTHRFIVAENLITRIDRHGLYYVNPKQYNCDNWVVFCLLSWLSKVYISERKRYIYITSSIIGWDPDCS